MTSSLLFINYFLKETFNHHLLPNPLLKVKQELESDRVINPNKLPVHRKATQSHTCSLWRENLT